MKPDGLYSTLSLVLAGVGFIVALLGYELRKRNKRLAVASSGFMLLTLGGWLLISTLEANAEGLAHVFSKRVAYVSKSTAPQLFEFSFWFHSILGTVFILLGLAAMLLPFTRAWHKGEPNLE